MLRLVLPNADVVDVETKYYVNNKIRIKSFEYNRLLPSNVHSAAESTIASQTEERTAAEFSERA